MTVDEYKVSEADLPCSQPGNGVPLEKNSPRDKSILSTIYYTLANVIAFSPVPFLLRSAAAKISAAVLRS